jgi:hypothetical protein
LKEKEQKNFDLALSVLLIQRLRPVTGDGRLLRKARRSKRIKIFTFALGILRSYDFSIKRFVSLSGKIQYS